MRTNLLTEGQTTEAADVLKWRVRELTRAGYEPYDALVVALRLDIDLHVAVDLVRNGCAPATAMRILL